MKIAFCSMIVFAALSVGCATGAPAVQTLEGPQTIEAQKKAQASMAGKTPEKPILKRKIAVGRVSNESGYGRSLLRDTRDDPIGKQVSDMLAKGLVESDSFMVIERPDIEILKNESDLSGRKLDLVGVDALVIGSVTELGRKVEGKTGFLSDSKKQTAFAKIDLRVVDSSSGLILASVAGAGEASTETSSVAGFGSQAAYDGTLTDAAIRQAVSEVVNRLSAELLNRPWRSSILQTKGDQVFISGGRHQGVVRGMTFEVQTIGERVKSAQTGFFVTLPGKTVGKIRVTSNFGETVAEEGSAATLVSGSLDGYAPGDLTVVFKE